jgi:hypothetical protein
MLEVDVRVNGKLIQHLYLHRAEDASDVGEGVYTYYWQFYDVATNTTSSGKHVHRFDDGAEKLIRDILTKVHHRMLNSGKRKA